MPAAAQNRAEKIIATGRVILAVASFAAVYFDPLEPRRYVTVTYSLLGLYAIYSLCVLLWIMVARKSPEEASKIASHAIDIAFFGTINYLTAGSSSPFFVYFVFAIVCAMLRFGRAGTLLTAATAGLVFISSGLATFEAPQFELNRFVIRLAYLAVVSFLLLSLSGYQYRIQRDLSRIATWPRAAWADRDELIRTLLAQVADIFSAKHIALAYQHLGERIAFTGINSGAEFVCTTHDSDVADAIIGRTPSASMVKALPMELRPSADRRGFLTVPIEGDFVRGRLLLLEDRPALQEDTILATIAGTVMASRLDHFYAAEQMQRGAVAEERVRVARDLHDSVLQALTGVSLQLSTLPKVIERDPIEFRERVSQIGDIIMSAQQELRRFIDELHPERRTTPAAVRRIRLQERLAGLAQRFWQQWRLSVVSNVEPMVHVLSAQLQSELFALLSEIVANAAKHANARRVQIDVSIEGNNTVIQARDDGHGFPFKGRYTLDDLLATRRGPVTLKDRVSSLAGEMVIDSSERGSSIVIRIPITAIGETA